MSFQRLGLLFLLFFSLKTCQDIKDDLIAENILILEQKKKKKGDRESRLQLYSVNI